MNAYDIIIIVALSVMVFLYLSTKRKLKKLDDVKDDLVDYLGDTASRPLSQLINSLVIMDTNKSVKIQLLEDRITERDKSIESTKNDYNILLVELKSARKELELKEMSGSKTTLIPSYQNARGLLAAHSEFVQSGEISLCEIRINAKDLIQEDYISVIKELHKIGLFPKSYEDELNFDPKCLAVRIELINYDEEGNTISFKSWDEFLHQRDHFIQTINGYVEGVINQKKINQAVDMALSGKEATSV